MQASVHGTLLRPAVKQKRAKSERHPPLIKDKAPEIGALSLRRNVQMRKKLLYFAAQPSQTCEGRAEQHESASAIRSGDAERLHVPDGVLVPAGGKSGGSSPIIAGGVPRSDGGIA
jgi:hypothetical protein